MRTVWEGSFFIWHSLAHVNRELACRLAKLGVLDAIAPNDREIGDGTIFPHGKTLVKLARKKPSNPSLLVRHAFPPNFCGHDGPVVLMQPWEFLRAPREWVDEVQHPRIAELWVNSHFTRNSFVLSGVPAEKVRVLPLGFDELVFRPDGPAQAIGEPEEFRFLYTGGTIERKGIDILMRAFLAEFRREEPVRLVVKDTGAKHVYIHANQREAIKRVVQEPRAPRVSYIEDDLAPEGLAALMRGCDCIVQPYRGEGFCLPVLEGMACGLAPIVTYGGPTDDLVMHGAGWKIASQRAQIAQLTGLEAIEEQGWLEPDQSDLQHLMREAFENRDQTRQFGSQAARNALQWTWDSVAPAYAKRIRELSDLVGSGKLLTKQPTITLCMIVRNEERVIGDCLASVASHFDQTIIVDTGSTDRTVEICKSSGAEVRHYPWTDSFADARNQSMIGATGDWIMWIDADDTVPPETIRAIKNAVANAPKEVVGFVIPVQFLEVQGGPGTRVDHVKVFRNLPGLVWEGRIHEQILPSLRLAAVAAGMPDGGHIARIDCHVLHSGYDTSDEGQARKRERDKKLLKLDLAERPNHPFVLFNLGMTAHYSDDHEGAVKWLKKSISKAAPNESHLRKAYALAGTSLRRLGKGHEARKLLEKGLQVLPNDPEMMFILAQVVSGSGEHRRAIDLYSKVIGADVSGLFTSLDPSILGYKARHNAALSHLELGEYEAARDQWQAALSESNKPEVAFMLFDTALLNQDTETAKRVHAWTAKYLGISESWANMQLRYSQATGTDPLPLLATIVERDPDNDGVRKVLATGFLNRGEAKAAIPHLNALQARGVPEGAFFLGVLSEDNGEPEKALAWYERAIRLNPHHPETVRRIANLRPS